MGTWDKEMYHFMKNMGINKTLALGTLMNMANIVLNIKSKQCAYI
jgi:hypothetical protein